MTQQMHNLSLLQTKKNSVPSSPNAAKRLYRNLSEKLKGSHTSFDEAYFRARSDRLSLRKTSMVITLYLSNCQLTVLLISLIGLLLSCRIFIVSLCLFPDQCCMFFPDLSLMILCQNKVWPSWRLKKSYLAQVVMLYFRSKILTWH